VDTKAKKHDWSELDEETDFPGEIIILGKKYDTKIPKCCIPRQSEKVRAFKTKDGKIVIHKIDCPNVYTCDLTKEVELVASKIETRTYPLRVDVKEKAGILGEILNFVIKEQQLVDSINTRIGKDGRLIITMDVRKNPKLNIKELMDKIRLQDSVLNVLLEDEHHTERFISEKSSKYK
jgi:(p)ppGpp synthase/HD superfamily hydrolase